MTTTTKESAHVGGGRKGKRGHDATPAATTQKTIDPVLGWFSLAKQSEAYKASKSRKGASHGRK